MKVSHAKQVGHEEDVYLMVRVAVGDELAHERLYRKYFPVITDYFASFCLHPHSVSDLTQEVFSRIWQSRQRYQPTATFKAYICGVARNVLRKRAQLAKDAFTGFFQQNLIRPLSIFYFRGSGCFLET